MFRIKFFVLFIININCIMSPNPLSSIVAASTGIVSGVPKMYLGKNFSVTNNSSTGVQTALPMTTSSTLTVGQGLNVNSVGGVSSLTINDSGDIHSNGLISVSCKYNINGKSCVAND
jgi:hypothetical protein